MCKADQAYSIFLRVERLGFSSRQHGHTVHNIICGSFCFLRNQMEETLEGRSMCSNIIELEHLPSLPCIPQDKTLIIPRSHTLLSSIIKSQTNDLRPTPRSSRCIMIYSILKYFSWFEPPLLCKLRRGQA